MPSIQGYASDHPDIELLRLKRFTIQRYLPIEEALGEPGAARVAETLGCMKTLVRLIMLPTEAAWLC